MIARRTRGQSTFKHHFDIIVAIMSSSPKIHNDGEELLRFAKTTSSLIRHVLEKVHRIPSNRMAKKKSKRAKKLQSSKTCATTPEMTETTAHQMLPHEMGTQKEQPAPVTGFDLPLCYFMNNMYEDSELSVENLLPSLKAEDFSAHANQRGYCPPLLPSSVTTTDHYCDSHVTTVSDF